MRRNRRNAKVSAGARLGQHFLTGEWAARALARAAGIKPNEAVLEIGPGKGALTRELLAEGGRIIAIEKDSALVQKLNDVFRTSIISKQLTVIEADVRDISPEKLGLESGRYLVAANIPYYITGEILRQFLTAQKQPRTIALLIQKEVADRIVVRDKKESILSLSVKAYGTPKIIAKVSRGNFSPPPSVDSAILVIENISRDFFTNLDEGFFFRVIKAGFASKRKKLSGNLGKIFGKEKAARVLAAARLPENVRAEDVPLDEWKKVAHALR